MGKLRKELKWFSEKMEEELKKNESKGGWLDEDYEYYLRRAKFNLREIKYNNIFTNDPRHIEELHIIKCCVDCANFCMMLADNVRELIRLEEEK